MRTLAAALALFVCTASSSACLFPFYPTYSTGYYGWGNGWGNRCGYPAYPAYRYSGYAPAYGVSYAPYGGCASGNCGVPYSAGYLGYANGCCNTCGMSSCCGGCSTCGVSGCSANCVTSGGVATEPTPDPLSDKTFRDSGSQYDRDRRDPDPLDDDFGAGGRSSRPDPADDFGAGGSRNWEPNRRTEPDPIDTDFGNGGMFEESESRKPAIDEAREFGAPADTDPDTDSGVIDRSANKPPVTDPLQAEGGGTGSEDEPPASPGEPASETATGDGAAEGEEEDVLPPEAPVSVSPRQRMIFASQSATRSNLHDVVRPGFARRAPLATRVSTSETKQAAPRWISVPMPAGRVRL